MCNQTIGLDKRVKIFKDREKSLWMFWTSYIQQAEEESEEGGEESEEESSGGGTSTALESIRYYDASGSFSAVALEDTGSYLLMTKSNSKTFYLPIGLDGKLNSNVFYAGYVDGGDIKPIKNCYYPEFHYDEDLNELTLVFWSNVDLNILTELVTTNETQSVNSAPLQFGSSAEANSSANTSVNTDDYFNVYPDYTVNPVSVNGYVPEAQRCLFYCSAQLRKCTLNTVNGSVTTQWFVFSRPVLMLCTGNTTNGLGDPVTDQISAFGFAEFKLN